MGGILYARREKDLKTMLGHHTVSQLGYMLLGLGLGAELGTLLYVVTHGLFKGLLFLCAEEGVEARGVRSIGELAGRMPWPAVLGLALGSAAIAGLPPLASFAAKTALTAGQPLWAKLVLVLLILGTAASFAELLPLFRGHDHGNVQGVILLSGGVLVFGVGLLWVVPGLVRPLAWFEALLAAGVGFCLHPFLRKRVFALLKFTLEGALIAALFVTVLLGLWLVV
ncbi:MAG: proton-conducting transporter membrane subunit [Candidatus Bipolaricaulaceae bacterium]